MQDPNKDAPKAIRDWLVRYAGLNPYGKPMWRVCLAQHVVRKSGGIFHEMPDGSGTMFDLDAQGKVIYTPVSAGRVTSGVFEIPRYPHDGWIMEVWMPPHVWGTRENWDATRSEDGQSLLGPYPHEGDYYLICGPFPKIPPIGDMEAAIGMYEQQRANRPINLANAIGQAIRDEESKRIAKKQKLIKNLEDIRREEEKTVFNRISLSAQRVRDKIQASLGLSSHFGVQ